MAFARQQSEPLSVVVTCRVTASDKQKLDQAVRERGLEIADIIREGLDLWFTHNAGGGDAAGKARKAAK